MKMHFSVAKYLCVCITLLVCVECCLKKGLTPKRYALNCTVQFKRCSLVPFARFDLFSKCWLSTSFLINFCMVVINLKRITVCHSFVGQCRSPPQKLKTGSPWWSGPVCQRLGLFLFPPLFYTPFLERTMNARWRLFVYFVILSCQRFDCHFVYFVLFWVNLSLFWLPLFIFCVILG